MDFFFDAHFHATLKKQFANPKPQPSSGLPMFNPWKTTERKDYLAGFNLISFAKCALKPFVENTLVSQASLKQMTDSNYKLAIVCLFCPDKGLLRLITDTKPFMKIIAQKKFGDILVDTQFDHILNTPDAFSVVLRDLDMLKEVSSTNQKIEFLTSAEFDPKPEDPLSLVFSIEGLHCLRSNLQENNAQTVIDDIIANLTTLTANHKVIIINIAHSDDSNNLFANQAYAADGFREKGFPEFTLRPLGNGFTIPGQQITQALYDREILPDVKHMSWLARKQFYEFRDTTGITAPIVCSHAGFTGCWFNSHGVTISDYILTHFNTANVSGPTEHRLVLGKPNPYLEGSGLGFNVSTINLFNEDIEAILKSDGLIGLSMDQRILGYSDFEDSDEFVSNNVATIQDGLNELKVVTDSDFISDPEFGIEPLFGRISHRIDKVRTCVQTVDRQTNNSTDVKDFFHPRHFYLHILHAIEIARLIGKEGTGDATGDKAVRKMLTQTLCIGSDFDGLIDGLDCCPDVLHIQEFKTLFVQEFGDFLEEAESSLPEGLTVQKIADRIFFENGRDFVLRRLGAINQLSV